MTTPKKATRDFKISSASMLIDSRVTLKEFIPDQKEFENLDADFAPPFEKNWQAAIDVAEALPTDEDTVDIQTGYTETVESTMEQCRKAFQDAKYFIEKAFPTKKAVQKEFGFDDYDEARKNVPKMTTFMGVLSKKVVKYQAQLLAVKFPKTSIDNILNLAKTLLDDKTEQETVINSRLSLTEDRTEKLNNVWAFRRQVAKAAKNIYKDNYSKYRMYLLPASEESGDIFDIQGTITDKASGANLENVKVSIGSLSVNTDSNGKYGLVDVAEGTVTITFELEGYQTATVDVVFDGKKLVQNIALIKI